MKRTINISVISGAVALCAVSCMGIDNFKEPSSRLHGTVTDSDSKQLILQDQGHTMIRIKEVSFPNSEWQNIPVKQDGTYNNNKLFAGHYDMVPVGAWWPCDTVKAVSLGGEASRNFEVTPYLRVTDLNWSLDKGTELTVSCRLKAPLESMDFTTANGVVKSYDMPKIVEMRVFLSLNQFCGSSNHITNPYDLVKYCMARDMAWSAFAKEDDGKTTTELTTPLALPLKSGYTYFMRVGVSTTNHNKEIKYNYSEIKVINVP